MSILNMALLTNLHIDGSSHRACLNPVPLAPDRAFVGPNI